MQLKQYQKEAVDFLVPKKYALLADDTGTGKTFTIIATLNKIKAKRLLIVCPTSIKYQWVNNLENLWDFGRKAKIQIINSSDDIVDSNSDVIIINYDLIIKPKVYLQFYRKLFFDVCVLDESHKLKSLNSKRTQILLTQYKIAKQAERTYCISGTPMTDHIIDFYPILWSLAREQLIPFDDYYDFGKRYCGGQKRHIFFRSKEKIIWEVKGATNLTELQAKLKDFMIRRTKEEIEDCITCKETPEHFILFEPTQEINNIVLSESEKIEESIEYNNSDFSVEDLLILRQFTTIRNKIAQEKFKIANFNLLCEIEQHDKVIIFTYHTQVSENLKKLLKEYNPIIIDGRDSAEKKYKKVKQFQDKGGKNKVLIGQIKAMGEGIDGLQFVADHAIFFELSLTPADIYQAKARLLRMGQKSPYVSFSYYVIKDTVEEKVLQIYQKKWSNISKLLTKEVV